MRHAAVRAAKMTPRFHLGGEVGVEFSEDCCEQDMVNEIRDNIAAGLEDASSWNKEYGKAYEDVAEVADRYRSLVEDVGSRFVPEDEV